MSELISGGEEGVVGWAGRRIDIWVLGEDADTGAAAEPCERRRACSPTRASAPAACSAAASVASEAEQAGEARR
ncbi:MAG: hypothetical protein AB1797_10060, partial [bacterium]